VNPFQNTFEERLRSWKNLRLIIRGQPLDQACVEVDTWWQRAPLIKHHLHPDDVSNWPDPWTLLSENNYSELTRAVGVCYTLLLSDIMDVQLIQGRNKLCEDHYLVLVGHAKYIINYTPMSVLSTKLDEFDNIKNLSLSSIKNHISK
jgi:hypothetical protein